MAATTTPVLYTTVNSNCLSNCFSENNSNCFSNCFASTPPVFLDIQGLLLQLSL